jgi:formylglycine-generating enzyme required for sulfatase activity
MTLPKMMQKGLSGIFRTLKALTPVDFKNALETLEQHFTLTAQEIAIAYQRSFEQALNAIEAGVTGKISILQSNLLKEFAKQVSNEYLPSFCEATPIDLNELVKELQLANVQLLKNKETLFVGDQTVISEKELAILLQDGESLAITDLILNDIAPKITLTETVKQFFKYNELLGKAMLFFLEEELRQNQRFSETLKHLEQQGFRQDVKKLQDQLAELMQRQTLQPQIQPHDEFTQHTTDSLQLIQQAVNQIKQLPNNNPQFTALAIHGGTLVASTGNVKVAMDLLKQARQATSNQNELGLIAFNLFQLHLKNKHFDLALTEYKTALTLEKSRYALHEVDKYPIEQILGAGGMGVVFLCHFKLQRKKVVVKCFWKPRIGKADEVFKEAFLMSEIAGEFVPQPLDYGYVDNHKQSRAYFVTEYLENALDGESWLKQKGKFTLEQGLPVALSITQGLKLAHSKNLLHLDLKPANLLFQEIEQHIAVKIIDFGLSQLHDPIAQQALTRQASHLTMLGQSIMGTYDYAPPEQLGFTQYGKPSVKSDIYALGKTLYVLLTNKLPKVLNQKDFKESPELFDLLCDCVEDDPKERPTLEQVIEKLQALPALKQQQLLLEEQRRRQIEEQQRLEREKSEKAQRDLDDLKKQLADAQLLAKQHKNNLKKQTLNVEEYRKQQAALEALQQQIATLKHETDEQQRQKLIELEKQAKQLKREQEEQRKREELVRTSNPRRTASPKLQQEPDKQPPIQPLPTKSSSMWVFVAIFFVIIFFYGESRKKEPRPPPQVTPKPLEKTFTNSIVMEFVLIPAGSFQMGSNKYDDEKPVHKVEIKEAFYLGKTEVTQKQYQAIMGDNPSHFKGENRPVENVSWNEAQEFIKKLNEKEGTKKYRLPTEAEWEYAARAGTTTKWSFGDEESELKNYAWYRDNSDSKTHEVGQKKPNGFGLFDMHGNVWEWTCSDYGKYSENNHLGCSSKNNAKKSLRGGSWDFVAVYCRSAFRSDYEPVFRRDDGGFRVVSLVPPGR